MSRISGKKSRLAVWRDALCESDLGAMAKLVGLVLSTFMDRWGAAFPGRKTIGRKASVSVVTVDSALAQLEAARFLAVIRSKGGRSQTNRYQATLAETASEQRRREWAMASLRLRTGEPGPENSQGGLPESSLKADAKQLLNVENLIEESCQVCGASPSIDDGTSVRCPECRKLSIEQPEETSGGHPIHEHLARVRHSLGSIR